jgi:hypothetical protein
VYRRAVAAAALLVAPLAGALMAAGSTPASALPVPVPPPPVTIPPQCFHTGPVTFPPDVVGSLRQTADQAEDGGPLCLVVNLKRDCPCG